jgi:hypothetical protein
MNQRHLARVLTVSGLILGGFTLPSYGQQPQSCQLGKAVIIAINSAATARDVAVASGDVVVNLALTGPTLDTGASLSIGRQTSIADSIKADVIKISSGATIGGSTSYNQLTNEGSILGGQFTPLALPVFSALPAFEEATFRGIVQNVSVGPGATRILAPGEYGDVVVSTSGKIVFTGGIYHLRSLDATGNETSLTFNGVSEVRVQDKFRTRQRATIGPATGSGLSAANIVFYVGGTNGADGQLGSTPEAARIGNESNVAANFYVLNGTLRLDADVVASGAFVARDVQVEQRAQLSRASFFVNRPPTANAQDVLTNGAEPLVITLTARDPENGDMVFAIQGSGLQFPSRGSLGAVIQGPPPFPGNPPGCNPVNTPGCVPPDPPRASATVTYTPNGAGNEENSFTFSATDACGNTGMAAVRINPPGDATQPPVAQSVDATDVAVETPTDTPRSVTLVAGAPPAATLTFSIESLPAHGALQDGSGATIESVPYALPSRKVTYTPATGFTGLDTFLFKATGSVGGSDTASVLVSVFPRPDLASDQSVTTSLNTPIPITLQGNSAGTGTSADERVKLAQTQAQILSGATIAGNVSDANGDGLGDGRDNLPGAAPVLIAAGLDVNLGAPSGTVNDPDNDATPSPNADPDPDVISATVSSDGTNLHLQVRYKAGTFDPQLTRAQFLLDTDRNPATGQPGSDSGCVNDNGIIGVEFLVNMGADLGTNAEVLQYQGTCNSFGFVGNGTTTFVTDGMDATVPLSLLGNSDGRLNFKVVISEQISNSTGFTGVLDYMPNVGLPPGESRTGIQGVARIQIEWNIGTLPSAEGIESAEVMLSTQKGTVDSLDTSFFAGTAEQDGVLSVSDFQAPADPISGVLMPVPAGSQTGDEGTFVFNVTRQLKAARAQGRSFFSVQGRVNETLAGGGFKRGLQVRSTATGNLSTGKEPKLEVVTTPVGSDLVFKITTLPVHGALTLEGSPVLVNQSFAFPPTLLYTPNLGFTGNDSFVYQVAEGTVTDLATVSISVLFGSDCEANGRPVGCAPN